MPAQDQTDPNRRVPQTARTTTRQAARPAARTRAGAARKRSQPAAARARRRMPRDARAYRTGAQNRLRRFRQGSILAVALTALFLMLWGGEIELDGQEAEPDTTADIGIAPAADPAAAVAEATDTIRDLIYNFYAFLPRLVLALIFVVLAALIARGVHAVLRRTLGQWERQAAASAVARLIVYLLAAVATVSVLAGDVRAVVGSVGLLGLAASWALQTPIESFTGWLLNSFRGYYRVGDRIEVGDVFGDVYRIDMLTTTVWEAGGPGKPVRAAQATGALITFPNWEVLRSNVVNYSRDFPYVWDEITFPVANESDLAYTMQVIEATARRALGPDMAHAAERYQQLLASQRLTFDVDEVPRVYLAQADAWTDCTLRYLIPVRSRRAWSSTLVLEVLTELARPEHAGRIISVYPRTEVLIRSSWDPADPSGTDTPDPTATP
jgi:small conductance mechanosensitive channel